jgi:hypothetical protein
MTEKTEKKPAKAKRVTVWNTGDRPLALPDGTLLPVAPEGEEEDDSGTVVSDWATFEENETIQGWIEEGLIEVGEAPAEEPEDEKDNKPKPRQQDKQRQDKERQEKERQGGQPGGQTPAGQQPQPKPKT